MESENGATWECEKCRYQVFGLAFHGQGPHVYDEKTSEFRFL
jgi:ribosomal protein L37AE/L43A